jgi:uncharacterized protein YndB with AHSA1/START domain
MERVYDAPRELVFKAYTEPDLTPRWWGPRRLTTTVEKMDVKPGGAWRYVQHDAEGNAYAFHGRYREVLASERLVYTFEFEGVPGHPMLETATFEERHGNTKLTICSIRLRIGTGCSRREWSKGRSKAVTVSPNSSRI